MHKELITILDFKGALLRAFSVAGTAGGVVGRDGEMHPSWQVAVKRFIEIELVPLLLSNAPRTIIAVEDKGSLYRTRIYPKYKERRKKEKLERDPILNEQIKLMAENVKQLMLHLGVKFIHVREQEADDVIALLCRQLKDHMKVVRTNDADLLQLVDSTTTVVLSKMGESFMEGDSYKECPLHLIRLKKSIVGDASDEYAGVRGLGEGKFNRLMELYGEDGMGQIEQCVATKDYTMLKGAFDATQDKSLLTLLQNKEEWETAYTLAGLNPDICYISEGGKTVKPVIEMRIPDKEKVEAILSATKSLVHKSVLNVWLPQYQLLDQTKLHVLKKAVEESEKMPLVSYDFESYDSVEHPDFKKAAKGKYFVDVLSQRLTGMSFCFGENYQHTYYVPFNHRETYNLTTDWAIWLIQSLHQSPSDLVVHNADFELSLILGYLDQKVEKVPFDTVIMSSYADENESAGLKALSHSVFDYRQQTYEETLNGARDMRGLTGREVLDYGCDDSLVTSFLFDYLYLVMRLEGSWEFYKENEVDWAHDRVMSFINGTDIDFDHLKKVEEEDLKVMEDSEAKIRELLEKHCMNRPVEDRRKLATELFYEELRYQYTVEGVEENSDRGIVYKESIWNDVYSATEYVPKTVRIKAGKGFSPTVSQINKLFELLGTQFKIEKTTQKYLSSWVAEIEGDLETVSQEAQEFILALMGAYRHLTKTRRDSDEYRKLESVANLLLAKYVNDGGKEIIEGDELNFGSPKQMQRLLYCKLGLPIRARSKVDRGSTRDRFKLPGSPATGNSAIAQALAYDVKDGDWRKEVLQEYKKVVKAKQTISLFCKPYPLWRHPLTGLLHPQIRNCGTVTRRPSGSSPNVLQVSNKDDAKIRKAYTSWHRPEKYVHVGVDVQSQELLIAAEVSGDPTMLSAFDPETKKSLHSVTGAGISHVLTPHMSVSEELSGKRLTYAEFEEIRLSESPESQILEEVRKKGKMTNFLTLYQGSAHSLSEKLLVSLELAELLIDGFYDTYPGLKAWLREVIQFARTYGYVETAYGNRRHMTDNILSDNLYDRSRQERQAGNSIIQGTAADTLKIILSEFRRRKMLDRYKVRAVKPVYDELSSAVPLAAAQEYCEEMAEIMRVKPPGFIHTFDIDMAIGKTWGSLEEIGEFSPQAVADKLLKLREEL